MPFKMIRDDITRVRADAIVNSANPEPCFASGIDAAVYKTAGVAELLEERKRIGRIAPGEVAVTAAFQLPAKYIIHTVGSAWIDGNHGEFAILRSCYRESLRLADQLGCESIALPLIATGVYGFPKDRALDVALSMIREHLEDSDLEVTLVVFGEESYQIASGLTEQIEEYIDEHYVAVRRQEAYSASIGEPGVQEEHDALTGEPWRQEAYSASIDEPWKPEGAYSASIRKRGKKVRASERRRKLSAWKRKADGVSPDEIRPPEVMDVIVELPEEVTAADAVPKPVMLSLEDAVNNLGESFQARLLRMIDERGMTDPEVYKRANIDRKLFSKIRCSENYIPKKKTIVALAIALRLDLEDTGNLLASAGLMLTNNSKADIIVSFCLENEIYDIFEVNALLFQFHQPILG